MNRRELMKAMASGAVLAHTGVAGADALQEAPAASSATDWMPAAPGIWKVTLGQPEMHSPVRDREIPPATESLQHLPIVSTAPLPQPRYRTTSRGVELELPLEPDELMYGFGLQMLSFQQRGKKRTIRVNADPRVDSGDAHAPVPFYVTTRGYGILVDTFRHATFYCGETHPRPTEPIEAGKLEVNTPQMIRTRDRGRKARVLIEVPRAQGVTVYLFGGPDLRTAVQRYNLFSGGGAMPPLWGLGFWYRPEMHLEAEHVLSLAREFREHQIPCDVIGLEPGWQTHAYSCTFAWDQHRFPDPAGFIAEAQKLGYRINLWEHAYTHPASPIFKALVPHSANFAVWDGLVPDFAGKHARRIFGDYHGHTLIDIGVSGFKLDECDNSDFTGGWSFPDHSAFPSGVDGEQMHAQFGLRYQDAIWNQFKQRNQSTYSLVRSSGALAASYPFVLYSDLYEHRDFIRALVNSGFSGLLWCPEVRDAASEEDLIRRLQSVVFSPLAMVNAWYIKNPPWKQINADLNNAGTLQNDWQKLEARCREIIGWRMQLLPYLQATFGTYQQEGVPPFRSLIMDYPHEKALSDIDDQYLIGDRMMVAPLFAGEKERTVVIPPGKWHDFWTGKSMEGGAKLVLPQSTENIPVYVKDGSIVPWVDVAQHSEAPEAHRITARVYGDGSLTFRAPESAGRLELTWNAATGRGQMRQATQANYEIKSWHRIG